ncbi:MAG: TonB-dependent receptor [Robiginitomaculum sp.]
MTKHTLRSRILGSASLAVVGTMMLTGAAYAADDADAPIATDGRILVAQVGGQAPSTVMDEEDVVEVTGIRRSLETAVAIKRNADNVVDSISAESMGRFPDLNLAESLQRISGVNIIRDDFRGGKIAIRGMNGFTKTQVNGQDLASPTFGGGFVFGMFESSVLSGVDVHKTPMVSLDEGGIAGVVNLKTRKALAFDDDAHFFVSAKGQYEQLAGKLVPDLGASAGFKNDAGTFGAYVSAGYQTRDFRSDSVKVRAYRTYAPDGTRIQLADLDETNTPSALFVPHQVSYTSRKTTGERLSIAGGAEWLPTEDLSLRFTGMYGEQDSRQPLNNLSLNPTGEGYFRYDVLGTQDMGSSGITANHVRINSPQMQVQERIRDQYFKTFAGTLDADWEKGPWDVHGALHYTKGDTRQTQFQVYSRIGNYASRFWGRSFVDNGLIADVNLGGGNPYNFAMNLNKSPADVNTFGWGLTNTRERVGGSWDNLYAGVFSSGHANNNERAETQTAAQLDFSREMDMSLLKSVDFGVKIKSEQHDNFQKGFGDIFNNWGNRDTSAWDNSFFKSSFGNEGAGFFGGDLAFQGLMVPDSARALAAIVPVTAADLNDNQAIDPLTGLVYSTNFSKNFNINQNLSAVYMQANLEQELNGMTLRGNVGFRYVDTARESLSKQNTRENGQAIVKEFEETKHFGNFLPQANLILDVSDDLVVRGSYSKTIGRISPFTLGAGDTLSLSYQGNVETNPLVSVNQSASRAHLEPYDANSFEFGAEWYNRPGSNIYATLFTKTVTNFLIEESSCPASLAGLEDGIITGTPSIQTVGGAERCVDDAGVFINTKRYFNADEDLDVKVDGFEVGLTQNFDFLEGFMGNFGVNANYTYLTQEINLPDDLGTTAYESGELRQKAVGLFSLSPHSFNLIGYYETDKFGIRMAGNYRSDFTDENTGGSFYGNARTRQGRQQWDMSGSYNINDQMQLGFEIVNLFDKDRYEFQQTESRFRSLFTEGRTLTMSASYTY